MEAKTRSNKEKSSRGSITISNSDMMLLSKTLVHKTHLWV